MSSAPVYLYHMCDIDNLSSIFLEGKLLSRNQIRDAAMSPVSISHDNIQQKRAVKKVPISPGGEIHDYVPFYFAPRSPMLYAIKCGNVATYNGDQARIVYLVSSVGYMNQANIEYVFTNRNATTATAAWFNKEKDLKDKIDWELMKEKYWNATAEDGDRKSRRSAEFLVYKSVPTDLIGAIGVHNSNVESNVRALVGT